MGIRLLSVFTGLLLISSTSFAAPKTAKPKKAVSAQKATVQAKSKEMSLDEEIEKELDANIQDEPTTQVEASPLDPPKSVMMRNQRQKMEVETEERVVQELESSRMADEKTRRERVFGNRIQPASGNEISTSMDYDEEGDGLDSVYYMGLTGGLVDSRAANVDGSGALGFSLGSIMPMFTTPGYIHSLGLEAGFLYSLLEGETRGILGNTNYDVDKYNVSATAKYILEAGWFVPGAGIVMAYTRRQYKVPGEDNFSNALDAGVALSGDVQLNESVSLGLEYRYMTNLSYDKDRDDISSGIEQSALSDGPVRNLEDIDYQMVLLNGKISF